MLKFMRTHATSWFIKILLTLIIVVFVLWGMGSIKSKKERISDQNIITAASHSRRDVYRRRMTPMIDA